MKSNSKSGKCGRKNLKYTVSSALRIAVAALCLSALMIMQGCATTEVIADGGSFGEIAEAVRTDLFGAEQEDTRQIQLALPAREGFEPVSDRFSYNALKTPEMREAYESIRKSIFLITPETDGSGRYIMKHARIPSSLDSTQIYIAKEAVLNDYPEAFWITGDYTVGNNLHDGNYITLYSEYSYEQIVSAFDLINAGTEEILAKIPDGANELERELIIHDALVDSIDYDSEAADDDNASVQAFSIYGALAHKKAVCSGYARAAKLLLNRVGIECRLVSGMSKDTGHMWNQVKIDGQWYNLDITWDDPITDGDVVYNRYSYFNITDEQINVDHEPGRSFDEMTLETAESGDYATADLYNFDLEECTATDANYYMMYAVHITATDTSNNALITEKIKTLARIGEEMFYIRFDESIDSATAEKWLTKNSGGKSSALGKSMVKSNNSGVGSRIKTCSLVRLATSENDVWSHVYAVRLIYA